MSLPRFELKFRINEATATIVRNYAQAHIAPDPYADPVTNSYPIDSLYLDSDDLKTFWRTVNGARRRYKLRVRTYDDRPGAPVFFEVKRCIDDKVVKERCAVRRSAVERILSGWLPDSEDLLSSDPEHFLAAENFVRLMLQIEAKPKAFVRYIREAWIGRDERDVRLTMDREIGVAPKTTIEFPEQLDDPMRPFGNTVVLELKFTNRMPSWFPDLARVAGLRESPVAKYCEGIMVHDQIEFSPIDWPVADPSQFYTSDPAPNFDEFPKAAFTASGGSVRAATALSFLEEIRARSAVSQTTQLEGIARTTGHDARAA